MKKIWQHFHLQLPKTLSKVFRHIWFTLAIFLMIFAVVFTVFRALTPWVKQYQPQIQTQLSAWTGQKINIQAVQTSWYWLTPVLKLTQVTITDDRQQSLHVQEMMIGIDLLESLLHWQLQPGILYIEGTHFKVRQEADRWQIEGLHTPEVTNPSQEQANFVALLGTILNQEKIIIKNVSAEIILANNLKIPVQNFNLKADHGTSKYRIYSKIIVGKKNPTDLTMIANLELNINKLNKPSGDIYLAVHQADLNFWHPLFPKLPFDMTHGFTDFNTWLTLKKGKVLQIQTDMKLKNAVLIDPTRKKPRKIQSFTANMALVHQGDDWKIMADHVLLDLDGIHWPENVFKIQYQNSDDSYQAYIKSLSLEKLLKTDIVWPKDIQPLLKLHPIGFLENIRVAYKKDEVAYFLSQFSELGWEAQKKIPGLTGLSGTLDWQPLEGHLEFDGEQTVLTFPKQFAPLTFDTFNASIEWKDLSQGKRISLDRLVISHPNLVLSATGAIDDPLGPQANLRLNVDFSAKQAQVWLPYIPGKGLKPKLDQWLKEDIPRITQASGRISLSGPVNDFPFDDGNGEFSIQAHVSGTDIRINKDWPLNADINGDIQVNKRNLTAEVDSATLAGVPIHAVNLSVPDIGLGKEVFLLHGQVEAPGKDIKAYVYSSPLRSHLARWEGLNVDNLLGLELNLEVPLYPESDHVYAQGALTFDHNPVSIDMVNEPAKFEDVTGNLQFNEHGLTHGGLEGNLSGNPFSLRVQPLTGPKSGTELTFEGGLGIEHLKKMVPHPLFSLMHGRLMMTGLWTVFPQETDRDQLIMNSSLVGLGIDLPKPLGKSISEIAPLTVHINFHPQQRMDLNLEYANRLQGRMVLAEKSNHQWRAAGDLHLGEATQQPVSQTSLRINGTLPVVNVTEWQKVWEKVPKNTQGASFLDNLKDVDLDIHKITAAGHIYTNLAFKAQLLSPHQWNFHVTQEHLIGDFTYDWSKNTVSGHLSKLYLNPKTEVLTPHYVAKPLYIEDIPNLDLTIDQLIYEDIEVGKFEIKSQTKFKQWILDSCTLSTPEYQLSMQGDWSQNSPAKASSKVEAQLHISNLAKAFERWHFTPAVDVHNGQIKFIGQWPGPFYAMSLANLDGQMNLLLKDGRISHLDRDTEEKLALGKLLSVLSLQTIPRRLKLDFSDLSQQGFSFDVFKGSFQIKQGVMSTHDSVIDGPVASGRMQGDLNLVHQLYDLDLRMTPYITASLPVVATIAGGPIAGLVTWAASSIASKGMQQISGYSYKISGPWLNPVVQQVSIERNNH